MFRCPRHRRLAAGAALLAATAALYGCTPKDYGADFPTNFAGLNREIVAFQTKVDKRLPQLQVEAYTPSLKLRRELRGYQDTVRNMAVRLSHYNKPKDVEDQANSLAGSLRDEDQDLGALRLSNGKDNSRGARAALMQLDEAARAVHFKRPRVAAIARRLGRS